MKKVVAILGSPRKQANTEKLVEAALAALPPAPREIKTVRLNGLKFSGCQACFACKSKSEICVVKDDLTDVLAQVAEADLVIMASPIYIGEVTGQMKSFIDRTFAYLKPDYVASPNPSRLAPGKKMFFIVTQGVPDAAMYEATVLGHYAAFFKGLGFEVSHFIAPGQGPEDITAKSPELVREAAARAAALGV